MLASLTKPRRLHFLNLDHGPITIKDPIHLAISALGPKTRALPENTERRGQCMVIYLEMIERLAEIIPILKIIPGYIIV